MTLPSQSRPDSDDDADIRLPARWARLARNLAWVVFFSLGLLLLVVREVLVPRVQEFQPQIVAAIERATGLAVEIETLSADWQGLRPRFHVGGLTVRDRAGSDAFRLERVDAVLSWRSVMSARMQFHRLVFHEPHLSIRRDEAGRLFIAGVEIASERGAAALPAWVLGHREVMVRNARVDWQDEQRAAPMLTLDDVNLRLTVLGARYRFAVRASAVGQTGGTLDLRGDLIAESPSELFSWNGQLYAALDGVDLGDWLAWVDLPLLERGRGSLRAWLDLVDGELTSALSELVLMDGRVQATTELPALSVAMLRGRIGYRPLSGGGVEMEASSLEMMLGDGMQVGPTELSLRLAPVADDMLANGRFSASRLDIDGLLRLSSQLPFPAELRSQLVAMAPGGRVSDVRLEWNRAAGSEPDWKLGARFEQLSLRPFGNVPGVSGLSGSVQGDHAKGRFQLDSRDVTVEMPRVFPEPTLSLASLFVEGGWQRRDKEWEVALDGLRFENPDAAGSGTGRYRTLSGGRGEIDIAVRLTRADATAVWRYLPFQVGAGARDWVRSALIAGSVPDARLRLRGDLNQFPYDQGEDGQFLVTVRVADASLRYADGWPLIDAINGEVRFEGPGMSIVADSGRILDVALSEVVADVPELGTPDGEVMTLTGKAAGETAEFLRFIAESPVRDYIGGFTDGLRAEGRGELDLQLVMPLETITRTAVKGEYRFSGNQLAIMDGLPPLNEARGRVLFTESTLSIPESSARALGEPLQLTAATGAQGGVRFKMAGRVSSRALRERYDLPALSHLSGSTGWQAEVDVREGRSAIRVDSTLEGVSSSLPAPLNKRSVEAWPLQVRIDLAQAGTHEHLRAHTADGRIDLDLSRRKQGTAWVLEQGGIGVFAPVRVADRGVMVSARLDHLDLDAWRAVLDPQGELDDKRGEGDPDGMLAAVDVQIGKLKAWGFDFSDFMLTATADSGAVQGRVASAEAQGSFRWDGAGGGALQARLEHLTMGAETSSDEQAAQRLAEETPLRNLPALDVVVDRFSLRGMDLGRLALAARNEDGLWRLDSLELASQSGQLTGAGWWRPGNRMWTELSFSLASGDVGALMTSLGYPAVISGGNAEMSGRAAWAGAPAQIHHPTLTGEFELQARQGQFRKLEPGVGRLLGILSLQALPRRLTLDFRDVFSEGFAFDLISGSISMASGVMNTEDLQISGPAAKIWVSGRADVARETQDLRVIVQPTLTESVAIGAAAGLINPVAGVVAFLAQRVLSDPIERMFAFSYAITGTWSDPEVERISGATPASQREP